MNRLLATALTLSASSLFGCVTVDDAPVADEAPKAVESNVEARSLALLRLSPTHTVEFLESQVGTQVLEKFHADSDWGTPQKFLFKLPQSMRSLTEIYRELAGDATEQSTLEVLGAADARVSVDGVYDVDLDEELEDSELAGNVGAAGELEALLDDESEAGLGFNSQALCAEPDWNWIGDDQWFRDNFCPFGTQYCDSLDATQSRGWTNGKNVEAYGFAQSHCATATLTTTLRLKNKACGFLGLSDCWQSFSPWVVEVPARWVYVHRNAGFRDYPHAYSSSIKSNGGSFVGLSVRVW